MQYPDQPTSNSRIAFCFVLFNFKQQFMFFCFLEVTTVKWKTNYFICKYNLSLDSRCIHNRWSINLTIDAAQIWCWFSGFTASSFIAWAKPSPLNDSRWGKQEVGAAFDLVASKYSDQSNSSLLVVQPRGWVSRSSWSWAQPIQHVSI
jgi:hypothetical protein